VAAEKFIAVEHPDFGQVAGVIADCHGIADITRHGRMLIAQSLEMDAVSPHRSRFCMHNKQEIEFFEAFGQARQEALAAPCIKRCFVNLAMDTGMIVVDYVA